MLELNKIFDVKSREARRKILDNYPISANDKNEILNKIGNSSGGESNIKIRYYKIADEAISYVDNYYPANCKCIDMGAIRYYAPYYTSEDVIAFMFLPCYVNDVFCNSLEEIYSNDTEFLKNFEEITEEEYYSIPTIKFNIAFSDRVYKGEDIQDAPYIVKTYECKMGMTFNEWFDSKYNVDNIKPFAVDGQIEQGKVVASFLDYDINYGCTIYGYSGVGIEFKYPIQSYFSDKTVNTPNGKETCQLVITG